MQGAALSGLRAFGMVFSAKGGYCALFIAGKALKRVRSSSTASTPLINSDRLAQEGKLALQMGLVVGVGAFAYRTGLAVLRKSTYIYFCRHPPLALTKVGEPKPKVGEQDGHEQAGHSSQPQVDALGNHDNQDRALESTVEQDWLLRAVAGGSVAGLLLSLASDSSDTRHMMAVYAAVSMMQFVNPLAQYKLANIPEQKIRLPCWTGHVHRSVRLM
jgi:hypothetical protein